MPLHSRPTALGRPLRRAACLLAGALALPAALHAQCPDGSPPPCRTGTSSMAGRVPTLPLNDSTWLILPFENTARSTEAEVIRQASVSQLYGELSRWQGVRVISDDRVADLLQQLPASQRERPGLESATALARRVGAGRIILGSYLALGGRASMTAKVYETRTGRELRVVHDALAGFQSTNALDSLGATFGRLSRALLDVPEGTGASSAGTGTSSMAAYRAYMTGMAALNRVDVATARASFDEAVRLDSNFAMPRMQLVRISADTGQATMHLQVALRQASALPPRARALVFGLAAQMRGERDGTCSSASQLLAADSSDADGWTLQAQCQRDLFVVVDNGQPRLRGDLNRALKAAERAYQLAPNALSSAQTMNNMLQIGSFVQCVPAATTGVCPPDRLYRVSVVPSGDSMGIVIGTWAAVRRAPADLAPAAIEYFMTRLARVSSIIDRMVINNAGSWLLNFAAGQIACLRGNLAEADTRFKALGPPTAFDTAAVSRTQYFTFRFQLALALERPAEFQLWADSLFARPSAGLPFKSMMGRFGEGIDTNLAGRQYAAWRPILAGIVPPGFDTVEQQIGTRLTGPQHDDFLQLTTLAGFHLRRSGPALDTAAAHPLKRYQAWMARGQSARAHTALDEFDRELLARHPNTPDDGGWLFSAESHLELGDSTAAFQRIQEFARRWGDEIPNANILEMVYFQSTTPRLWGRAWLLYGDLAAARGQNAEARRAYRMVVGLWEHGDPVVQPAVSHARAALVQLGG